MKTIKELRYDYTDEQGFTCLDAYFSEDDMEQGETIAVFRDGYYYFIDNQYRNDPLVKEALKDLLNE